MTHQPLKTVLLTLAQRFLMRVRQKAHNALIARRQIESLLGTFVLQRVEEFSRARDRIYRMVFADGSTLEAEKIGNGLLAF